MELLPGGTRKRAAGATLIACITAANEALSLTLRYIPDRNLSSGAKDRGR
jgi:hypothetical protein